MKKFWKTKTFYFILILILGIGGYFYFKGEDQVELITEKVVITDVNQVVSVNGTVESHSKIELRFQDSGKIEDVNFEVGDNVFEGDILAKLENRLLKIEIDKAKADLNIAQADLNLEYAGPSYQEIRISEAQIQEALINLRNSELTLADTNLSNIEKIKKVELEIENAEIAVASAEKDLENLLSFEETTEDIVRKDLESAYKNSDGIVIDAIDTIRNSLTVADSILGIDDSPANDKFENLLGIKAQETLGITEAEYKKAKAELKKAEDYSNQIKDTWLYEEVDILVEYMEEALNATKQLMDDVYIVLEGTLTDYYFTLSELEALKNKVLSRQNYLTDSIKELENLIQTIEGAKLDITSSGKSTISDVDMAKSNLEDAEKKLEIAERALEEVKVQNIISGNQASRDIDLKTVMVEQARANHAKLIADPRYVDVAAMHARVNKAQAVYAQAIRELEDIQIISPVDGQITEINMNKGENVSLNEDVVVLITDKLQIKTNISETDITKIKVGNEVEMNFDSLPLDKYFRGKVVAINPAETIIQGVIYYETTVILETTKEEDEDVESIRSGMTANMDIFTDSKKDVLAIPPQAVEYENGSTYVYVIINGIKNKVEIETGLEGETLIEVLSGLEEGQEVLLYEK